MPLQRVASFSLAPRVVCRVNLLRAASARKHGVDLLKPCAQPSLPGLVGSVTSWERAPLLMGREGDVARAILSLLAIVLMPDASVFMFGALTLMLACATLMLTGATLMLSRVTFLFTTLTLMLTAQCFMLVRQLFMLTAETLMLRREHKG